MRKILLGLVALALVASAVSFAGAGEGKKYNKNITIGQKAPSFSGIPAIVGDQEASVSLSDIKEEVVVLVFLANHCPTVGLCEDRLIELAQNYKGKSVKFVGVSVSPNDDDKLPAIKSRVAEKGYGFAYAYDETQEIGRAYGANKTPELFILDSARNVRYAGAMDDNAQDAKKVSKQYAKAAIDSLLAGKEVEVSTTRAVGCGIQYKSR